MFRYRTAKGGLGGVSERVRGREGKTKWLTLDGEGETSSATRSDALEGGPVSPPAPGANCAPAPKAGTNRAVPCGRLHSRWELHAVVNGELLRPVAYRDVLTNANRGAANSRKGAGVSREADRDRCAIV